MAPMVMQKRSRWKVALATLVLWALAGASMVHWGIRWLARPQAPVAAPLAPPPVPLPDAQAIARLLGARAESPPPQASQASAPAPAAPRAQLVLQGVLAGSYSGTGAALISTDGRPPRPYRIGQEVAPGLVLQALSRGAAQLGDEAHGEAALTLQVRPRTPDTGAPAAAPAQAAPPPPAPPAGPPAAG